MTEALEFDEQPEFRDRIFGTLGRFRSPAGSVGYLLTRARLGAGGTDPERRLAEHIVPFREVVPAGELQFAQLLQRDINDFRVAEELIPYMLRGPVRGPAMFPPILCVILPFDGPDLAQDFGPRHDIPRHAERGLHLEGWRRGEAFAVERLVTSAGGDYPMSVGRVSWNGENARVVVLDGQHRAMALLAVQRTMNRTWDDSRGRQYRAFYERSVERLLAELPGGLTAEDLQVPVAICWFEDENPGLLPHQAARQLFVDVNKSARPPSTARLTLLSETELLSIFARSVLDVLRSDPTAQELPLAAVEYDNPDRESARPVKWSVMTTLEFVKHAIHRMVWGPQELVATADRPMGRGRRPQAKMDRFMRKQLQLVRFVPVEIEDLERRISREEITNTDFPRSLLPRIIEAFSASWGAALITLLSDLQPYAAHHRALAALDSRWAPDDVPGQLAKEAIFGGTGLYWTLRSTHEHWVSLDRPAERRTEAVDAWERLQDTETRFRDLRTGFFLETTEIDETQLTDVARVYAILNTAACQVGLALTLASVAVESQTSRDDVRALATTLVTAINAALAENDRRFVFDTGASVPLVRIQDMNTPSAVHFRYFWLETIATSAAMAQLTEEQRAAVRTLLPQGRSLYLALLERQEAQNLQRADGDMSPTIIADRAKATARRQLTEALARWFSVDEDTFAAWYDTVRGAAVLDEDEDEDDEDVI